MNKSNSNTSQPPLSYFDRAFCDNPGDALFCSLNEIDPIFMDSESFLDNEFTQQKVTDPRNNLPVTQRTYDHTKNCKPDLFKSTNRSLLTKKEHQTCVAFLQALKTKKQIYPHQLQCFELTLSKRQLEKEAFHKFLLQYNNTNYEKIYAPELMLVDHYKKVYKSESERLIHKHTDGIFQIHTGLPMPRLCGSCDMSGIVSDVELVSKNEPPQLSDTEEDLSKMKANIETYLEAYDKGATVEMNPNVEPQQTTQFGISIDALVFLLCAGEYIDIPNEVIVQISPGDDDGCVIHINETLPSRNTGIHTSDLVVNRCAEMFLAMNENKNPVDIKATGFSGVYSLQAFDDFLSRQKSSSCYNSHVDRSCSAVTWNLRREGEEQQISIFTQMKQGYKVAQRGQQVLNSVKLEFKPEFGCEVQTKASLLREWFAQRLSGTPYATTHRHRIRARTFKTVLNENLSLEDIEQELERHYNTKIPRLLGSLDDFLRLLTKVTPGRYLLRFNQRFQDKLILYGETKDASSKTSVTLHGLLREIPTDMPFMTSRQFTAIDDTLCSAMHDFYQILPCSFPPWRTAQPHKIIDDRNFILKKVEQKMKQIEAKTKKMLEKRKKVKRMKRKQKLKAKAQQKKEENEDKQELEKDIRHDRLLYGFGSEEQKCEDESE